MDGREKRGFPGAWPQSDRLSSCAHRHFAAGAVFRGAVSAAQSLRCCGCVPRHRAEPGGQPKDTHSRDLQERGFCGKRGTHLLLLSALILQHFLPLPLLCSARSAVTFRRGRAPAQRDSARRAPQTPLASQNLPFNQSSLNT